MIIRSYLKKVFSLDISVEPSYQILDILEYACGLILGLALISTENPNFETASKALWANIPMEKHVKFLTVREAIRDIIGSILRPDCIEEIAEIFSFLEGGSARTSRGIHPLAEDKTPGIIYKPKKSDDEEFYRWSEFEDLLTRAMEDRLPEDIAFVYTKVFWVHSYAGIDSKSGEKGIWVETEMEKFRCKHCGHCCINLSDAYCYAIPDEDVNRWKSEHRCDILKFVDQSSFFNDIWIDQETGEELGRCPWLKQLSNNKYICRIHHTKPTHCRNYPHSKRHALTTGCKGFDPD